MAELAWSDACERVMLALRRDWGKPWKSATQAEEAVTFYIEGQGDTLIEEPKYWDDRMHPMMQYGAQTENDSTSLATAFQIKRIALLEKFLTTDQIAELKAALDAYYQTKLGQAEAIKRKEADPRTRCLPPRMDDEINLLEVAGRPHSKAIRNILENSTLPEMPKPIGLLNVDGTVSEQTTLGERLWSALCEFQRERAKLDVGQTSLDVQCAWRDVSLSKLVEEAISDLAKAACNAR